ncbi:uncharacterized protein LOC114541067 [Dendronephthya gigantea]|uniref:uncharacterized protein LOC114541067 n=1 Tax=Dendronephthya gigantea TaxID=151771 RepID=UPI001069136F|nr:uncharacterized protein LOC114541067 [Dendronephthya gigantea]
MNIEGKSLFNRIKDASKEIGDILEANEIVETEDIQQLCYEALSEIFPGGGRKLLQRSKVWKIIQASLNDDNSSISSKPSTSTIRTSSPAPSSCEDSSFFIDDVECSPITKLKSTSPGNNNLTAGDTTDLLPAPKDIQSHIKPLVVNAPTYTFYSDLHIQAAVREGKMDKKIRERLIRGTINNMVSASSVPPFNRFPTSIEISEMAKSLIIAYPCLKDEETGHCMVLKALKRRLSNTKPVMKPQGHCPNKRKYSNGEINQGVEAETKKKKTGPQKNQGDDLEILKTTTDSCENEVICEKSDPTDGKEVMKRHYAALMKEVEKKSQM